MLAENDRKRKLDGPKQPLKDHRQADARPTLFRLSAYLHRTCLAHRLHSIQLKPLHQRDLDAMLPGKGGCLRIAGIHMAHNAHARIVG